MIKLTPRPCPPELTPEVQARLTAEYLADTTKAVWQKPYIMRELLLLSSNKCCYCECNILKEDKYVEAEHWLCKKCHPHEVVNWANLLPACKRCNGGCKRDHDCAVEPIIHPVRDEPRDHLKWRAYRFYEKTTLGRKTIEVVKLNDWQRLVMPRFEVGKRIHDMLDGLKEIVLDLQNGSNISQRRQDRIIYQMKSILGEALTTQDFAATAATVLVNEPLFEKVKSSLLACSLWDEEMSSLETAARQIALDVF